MSVIENKNSETGLLLVELLSTNRYAQYRSEQYPFFLAFCRSAGIRARHVGVGFDPDAQPNNRFIVQLTGEDVAELVRVIREHRATHVFFNERLEPESEAEVVRAAPGIRIRYMEYADLRKDWPTGPRLLQWLDLPHEGMGEDILVDRIEPVYDREPLNPLAHQVRPLVKLICGLNCVHHRPLSRSPEFSRVDLSGPRPALGCSFCSGGINVHHPFKHPPLDLALRQILALEKAEPPRKPDREFDLEGIAVFLSFGRFFERVIEAGVPPSAFYFSCRIDEVLRKADEVESWLPRINRAGHQVHFWNMGVENFSPRENDRFNKNITFDQVVRVEDLMTRWEREWPDTVFFHAHGAYGFILFTPWTTLDDLELNAQALRKLPNLEWDFYLSTRLQLLQNRPISQLAELDGLTVEEFGDPMMVKFCPTGCINEWDQQEIPWRFAHPQVGLAQRIMLRRIPWVLARDFDDPDLDYIKACMQKLPAEYRNCNLTFFEALLRTLRQRPELESVTRVMEHIIAEAPEPEGGQGDSAPAGVEPPVHPHAAPGADSTYWKSAYRKVEKAMQSLASHPVSSLLGFAVREVAQDFDGATRVVLERGGEELWLRIVPNEATDKAYRRTAALAVIYLPETPLDSSWKKQAVEAVARALEIFK